MTRPKRFWCWLFGHRATWEVRGDPRYGGSTRLVCRRCDRILDEVPLYV